MFINDVVRLVRRYYPSEYDTEEMYIWCDEVSSMLTMEDRQIYKRISLPVQTDGSLILPDGVDMENVVYFISGGRVLNKSDFREYGNRKFYVTGMNGFVAGSGGKRPASITVDYLAPFEPIRLVKYRGRAEIDKTDATVQIDFCEFQAGDIINITVGADSFNNVPVLGVSFDGSAYTLSVPNGAFDNASETSSDQAEISRVVTDSTVCPPPFDSMYVDYVLAKINMYQRDMDSYNQFMTAFNSRLLAYKNWLISKMPKGDGRFKNWW